MLFSLGSWQLYRLNWKLDLINQIEQSLKSSPIELINIDKKNYLRIKTSGKIDFEKQIYLYNLNESGKPGFEVINPILINNENYLINRGWIPFDKKDRSEINYINQNDIIGLKNIFPDAIFISALEHLKLGDIKKHIINKIEENFEIFDLNIPYHKGKVIAMLQNQVEILDTDYRDEEIYLKVKGSKDKVNKILY